MKARQVTVSGKFFRHGAEKFYVKGFSYGPFAPNSSGEPLPEPTQVEKDFLHIRELGANTVRVYYPPPLWFLECALQHGLKVFVDVPWEKHRCFFEDWESMERARAVVRTTAKEIGNHPAVLAISVANELPVDIVRFQGRHKVERFLRELIGIVKHEAPDCLTTFVNFPTTEFLEPEGCDFCTFNVYLHDESRLGAYLDRLQHIAANRPLVLGEFGMDSLRNGENQQAVVLANHLQRVFRHGLAGSVIFAYTDDWYTGGHQIDSWRFGVCGNDRAEKPAAERVRQAWRSLPPSNNNELPKVSVVVCCYNGGSTLRACLESLMHLQYPDYEVILVDDGSTDATPTIAADFFHVVYHRQDNQGLSTARNVGAQLATGEIIAYTDSDCVVDEHWLRYLVEAMKDQQVEAIGGPNITPDSDSWVAKCVAASPGNPSHVMLNDQHAEHIPGCNMAFRRSTLLGLGGFDPQFRVAGDDVDMCWRFLDAGLTIGYASGAMVWHHRRATLAAFGKQQKGYGRSEALVHFKHPKRCGAFGRSSWKGIIYGDGAVGLPLMPDRIYHGRFGGGLFQTIYRHNEYGLWSIMMSLEWHLGAAYLLLMTTLFPPLAFVSTVMWSATLLLAIRSASRAPLPRLAPWWCRPVVAYLYLMQPLWRGWYRTTNLLRNKRLPCEIPIAAGASTVKRVSGVARDLYWQNNDSLGREILLEKIADEAGTVNWAGDFDDAWSDWDIKLAGDRWHDVIIHTATEELGWPNRFTRARCRVRSTALSRVIAAGIFIWSGAAMVSLQLWAIIVAAIGCALILVRISNSRRRCLRATVLLVARAAELANLVPFRQNKVPPASQQLLNKQGSSADTGDRLGKKKPRPVRQPV
jgi:glycosyltransferase involved in cell wall biosynthesis